MPWNPRGDNVAVAAGSWGPEGRGAPQAVDEGIGSVKTVWW